MQLFIIFLKFEIPTFEQTQSIITSVLDLTTVLCTKYISNSKDSKIEKKCAKIIKAIKIKKKSKIADVLKKIIKTIIVAPVFFLHVVFQVFSATILLLFCRSFSLVILAIYSALLKKILVLFGADKKLKDGREFKQQLVESIYLREEAF